MFETIVSKDHEGKWKATTEVELRDNMLLRINTSKSGKSLVTHASVFHIAEDGHHSCVITKDFSKQLHSIPIPRVTKDCVATTHKAVLIAQLEALKVVVNGFYKANPGLVQRPTGDKDGK